MQTKLLKWPLWANYCDIFSPHSSLYSHRQTSVTDRYSHVSCFHLRVFPLCLTEPKSSLFYLFCVVYQRFFAFFEFILSLSGFVHPAELTSHFGFARFSDQRLSSAENRSPCAKHAAFSGCTWVQPSPWLWHQCDLITWLSLICPGFLQMQVKSRVDLSSVAVHLRWEIRVKWKTKTLMSIYSGYMATNSFSKFS